LNLEDLALFRQKAKALSVESLDKDLAELSYDIQFLDAQLNADLQSYAPVELARATEKISLLRQKAEIIVLELDKKRQRP